MAFLAQIFSCWSGPLADALSGGIEEDEEKDVAPCKEQPAADEVAWESWEEEEEEEHQPAAALVQAPPGGERSHATVAPGFGTAATPLALGGLPEKRSAGAAVVMDDGEDAEWGEMGDGDDWPEPAANVTADLLRKKDDDAAVEPALTEAALSPSLIASTLPPITELPSRSSIVKTDSPVAEEAEEEEEEVDFFADMAPSVSVPVRVAVAPLQRVEQKKQKLGAADAPVDAELEEFQKTMASYSLQQKLQQGGEEEAVDFAGDWGGDDLDGLGDMDELESDGEENGNAATPLPPMEEARAEQSQKKSSRNSTPREKRERPRRGMRKSKTDGEEEEEGNAKRLGAVTVLSADEFGGFDDM